MAKTLFREVGPEIWTFCSRDATKERFGQDGMSDVFKFGSGLVTPFRVRDDVIIAMISNDFSQILNSEFKMWDVSRIEITEAEKTGDISDRRRASPIC